MKTWERAGMRGRGIAKLSEFEGAPGMILFASADSGIYRTLDSGATWQQVLAIPPLYYWGARDPTRALFQEGPDMIAVFEAYYDTSRCVWHSTDVGASWSRFASLPLGATYLVSADTLNGSLFAISDGLNNPMLWSLPLSGGGWSLANYPSNSGPQFVKTHGRTLFVGTSSRIDFSTNFGISWDSLPGKGLSALSYWSSNLAIHGLDMVVSSSNGIFRSSDGGSTWFHADGQGGYPDYYRGNSSFNAYAVDFVDNAFCVGEYAGLFRSADGITWRYVPQNTLEPGIWNIATLGNKLFASTENGAVYRSTDRGETWSTPADLEGTYNLTETNGSILARGDAFSAVYFWSNVQWDTLVRPGHGVVSLAAIGDTIFSADGFSGIWRTIVSGQSWQQLNKFPGSIYNSNLFTLGDTLFELSNDYAWDLYESTDRGDSWSTNHSFPDTGGAFISLAAVNSSKIALGIYSNYDRLYQSANGGETWYGTNDNVLALGAAGSSMLASLSSSSRQPSGLYDITTGFHLLIPDSITSPIQAIASDDSFIYIGTTERGMWRTALSSLPSRVESLTAIPTQSLEIYPNPISSEADVSFMLTETGFVSLKLFDELGIERATIFEGGLAAGQHQIPFADPKLPNGNYEVVLSTPTARSVGPVVIER